MSSSNLKNKRSFTESNSVSTSTDAFAPSEPIKLEQQQQQPHIQATTGTTLTDANSTPHAPTLTHSTSESKEDADVRMENASTPPPLHKRARTVEQENSGSSSSSSNAAHLALSPNQQATAVQTEPIGMSAETQTDPSVTLVSPISLPMTILSHINSPPSSADAAAIAHSTTRLTVGTPPQVSVTYQYSIPPASAVKSPRRATVCASLELAAAKSASLTNTTIHPAILHSLSVRLQAMSDEEAEIVLRRLQQLAAHIDAQRHHNEMQQQMRNIMHQAAQAKRNRRDLFRSDAQQTNNISPSQTRGNTPASTMLTAATAPSALPPPSPTMPALGSVSSLDSGNTSDTTSPALSPAVGAATPPAPPSPALIHHTMSVGGGGTAAIQPGSGGSIHTAAGLISKLSPSLASNPHHPPLHPTLLSKPSLSTSPSSRAHNLASPSSKLSMRPSLHSPPQSSHSISTFAPSAAHEPAVSTTTSEASSSTAASSSTSNNHRPNGAGTINAASASEDSSNIPLGLMMLIEALPGSNHGPLTAAGDFTSSKQEAVEQELTAVAIASDAPHKPEGISRLKSTAASPFRQTMEKRHRRARVDEESNAHNNIQPNSQLGSNETFGFELPPHIELRRSTSC